MAKLVVTEPAFIGGITELFPQRPQQHVGLLGDEQELACGWTFNVPLTGGPKTTDHPQQ